MSTVVTAAMLALLEAVRVEYETVAGTDPFVTVPSSVVLAPGRDEVWDDTCGMLYGRVDGVAAGSGRGLCGPASWTVNAAVGVIRCAATVDDNGDVPTAGELTAEEETVLDDMAIVHEALAGQLAVLRDAACVLNGSGWEWVPKGPQGGGVGGEWRFSLTVTTLTFTPNTVAP